MKCFMTKPLISESVWNAVDTARWVIQWHHHTTQDVPSYKSKWTVSTPWCMIWGTGRSNGSKSGAPESRLQVAERRAKGKSRTTKAKNQANGANLGFEQKLWEMAASLRGHIIYLNRVWLATNLLVLRG